jgi:general secretion pathway protein E
MQTLIIDHALIQLCQKESKLVGQRPIDLLEKKSGLDPATFVVQLAKLNYLPSITLQEMIELEPLFDRISFSEGLLKECVLLRKDSTLLFIFADIYNQEIENWAAGHIGAPFVAYLAHHQDIIAYLAKHEDSTQTVHQAISGADSQAQTKAALEELSLNRIETDTNPVVKLVRSTLFDALRAEASDIHIETQPHGLHIKYRLDGVLTQMGAVNEISLAEQVISRIKVIAELDITEQRVPQDGRFRSVYRGRDVDFRVSVMPSIHGEDVVIRVLDKQTLADKASGLRLDVLGFNQETMQIMRDQFAMPYGMVLLTGPTGSGKTTSLYAAISEINHGSDKIITIEDPVEYQLAGVLQIPVNEKKGLTFARGLRSILRHDPDKIMVGEIRDAETAQIAVQSALTGHLVFTSVHANNAFDVIGRFLNMGVDPYSFVSALNVVVAQRLLRVICLQCVKPKKYEYAFKFDIPPDTTFYHGEGCGACRGTGYKGRHAVAEILQFDDEMRELIANKASIKLIKAHAIANGTKFLHDAALQMALAGRTTLEEVQRVAPKV